MQYACKWNSIDDELEFKVDNIKKMLFIKRHAQSLVFIQITSNTAVSCEVPRLSADVIKPVAISSVSQRLFISFLAQRIFRRLRVETRPIPFLSQPLPPTCKRTRIQNFWRSELYWALVSCLKSSVDAPVDISSGYGQIDFGWGPYFDVLSSFFSLPYLKTFFCFIEFFLVEYFVFISKR